MQQIRIMIAGTQNTPFSLLVRILGRASELYEVVARARDEDEALKLLQGARVDVVLVDASLPEGFDLCRRITGDFPAVSAVLVGGEHSYDCLKRAMDVGARGYIADDACTGEGMKAEINRVLQAAQMQIDAANPVDSASLGNSRAVEKVMDFVRQNYRRNVSFAEAAEYAGISESHLRRCFRQETGMSFVDFLTKYRIDTAKRLMDTLDIPVNMVSEQVGFSSPRYFCRVFKKATNLTPREYIQNNRKGGKAK